MKLAVEFPSVAFREGPEKVVDLARAIEEIGYDELAVFDHVVMGFPTDSRPCPDTPRPCRCSRRWCCSASPRR